MYIVAIAWLYVTLMMALTEPTVAAGVLTFLFYGLLPCALLVWLVGTPQRRRNRLRVMAEQELDQPDRADPKSD
jgi:biotin transporter BioY